MAGCFDVSPACISLLLFFLLQVLSSYSLLLLILFLYTLLHIDPVKIIINTLLATKGKLKSGSTKGWAHMERS